MKPGTFSESPILDNLVAKYASTVFGVKWEENTEIMIGNKDIQQEDLKMTWREHDDQGLEIQFFKKDRNDFLLNDPAQETPAILWFNRGGKLLERNFYQGGYQTDPGVGIPAYERHCSDGKEQIFLNLGVWQGQKPEEPGRITYYTTGELHLVQYYKAGELRDTPAGRPAQITYKKDGTVSSGWSSKNHDLTAEETQEAIANAKINIANSLCGTQELVGMTGYTRRVPPLGRGIV